MFLEMGLEDNGLRAGLEMVMEGTQQVADMVMEDTQLVVDMVWRDKRLNEGAGMESGDKVQSYVDMQGRPRMVDILRLELDRELQKLVEGIRILMRLLEGTRILMAGEQVMQHMVLMRHDSLQACWHLKNAVLLGPPLHTFRSWIELSKSRHHILEKELSAIESFHCQSSHRM